jgi:hypothetical protein
MQKGIIIGLAMLFVVAGGAVEYARMGRSANTDQIAQARAKLKSIPLTIGEWKGVDEDFDARQLAVAEASGYCNREYIHQKTQEHVRILIICGSPSAIGAHDPTVCYGGSGFQQKKGEEILTIAAQDQKSDAMWKAQFDTETLPAISLQVLWAWSSQGLWIASSNPRFEFANEPLLYKIYVSRQIGPREDPNRDPSVELLKELLPAIRSLSQGSQRG